MGNRGGMFHDPATLTLSGRRWGSRRWLCCSLTFPGRHRHPVWSHGYTQLFFLDEITALAAGHRPCAECRRDAARAFQAAAAEGARSLVRELDRRLHEERLGPLRFTIEAERLPDGVIVSVAGSAYAVRDGRLLLWTPEGYEPGFCTPGAEAVILTPPTTLAALAAGYLPLWHPTASGAGAIGVAARVESC